MTGFIIFLLVVFAAGFIYLTFESKFKKSKITIPQSNEMLISPIDDWNTDVLPKKAPRINQAHWQTRTFERPRRKVRR